MANVFVNNIAVPRIARNKRVYGGNFATSAGAAAGGSDFVLDWAAVTESLVTINRDLHVTGNITASEEVVAWIAGAVESDVLANLTATAPLRKSTNSNIVLDYDTSQFEVVGGNLKIRDDFAGGGSVTSVGLSAPTGFAVTGSPVTGAGTLALAFASGYSLPTNVKQGQWDSAYSYSQIWHIPLSQKGSVNGVAELDGSGKVLSSQLPSYVDDVLEYSTLANFPATGESGKIYIAQDTNLSYRWTGSGYAEISPSLALGETSSTAYRGDRGKIAYDHSQIVTGNPHQLGINDLTDGSNVAKLTGANFTGNIQTNGTTRISSTGVGTFSSGTTVNGGTVWHSGNDGPGSGLNADFLDGVDSAKIVYGTSARKTTRLDGGDANAITESGFYFLASGTNTPSSGFSLINVQIDDTDLYSFQIGKPSTGNTLYYRGQINSIWEPWNIIWNSSNANLSTIDWAAKKLTAAAEISTNSSYQLRNASGALKWSFELSGDDLIVKNSAGTIRGKITQAGDLAVEGEVTAFAVL